MSDPDFAPIAFLRLSARDGAARWRRFADPVRIIQTARLDEVQACLAQIEAGVQDGLYAVGFVAYEAAAAFEPAFPTRTVPDDFPLLWFGLFTGAQEAIPDGEGPFMVGAWQAQTTAEEYAQAIADIREEIAAGNTYQVNYTVRLRARFEGDDLAFFAALAQEQPTEYAAYLNLGRYRVLSVSPELFFRVQDGVIRTRPMKGTVARGATPAEDEQLAEWLRAPGKNRAENVMIVDLLRNDLGRVAEFGSVQVPQLCQVEVLPTLLTMTSTIQARLRPGTTLSDLFRALFPCGSVTGAPKINTMRLIDQLEPQSRRVYCGAVGIVEPGGNMVFNVPIRTVLLDTDAGVAEYGVGGGITWDSHADDEYAEVMTKSRVLTQAAPPVSLLETFRLQDGVFVHLAEHLERLAGSAQFWGYPFDHARIQRELQVAALASSVGVFRCRLLLHSGGEVQVQVFPLESVPTVRAALARTPIHSRNPFLRFKTTRREVYEAHSSLVPPGEEVLLYNERGELTEFITGNLVVQLAGRCYTPPLACGVLPGVGRGLALREGHVSERVLTLDDLAQAEAVWHVNSLRGWRAVVGLGQLR